MWYVYCLENEEKSFLYIGSTNNLKRGIYEYNIDHSIATKSYLSVSLAAYIAENS